MEILVVLGLFSSIMTLAAGTLFMTQAVNVKLQQTQAVLDNVNLSVETMTREIRYGSEFHCGVISAEIYDLSMNLRKSCPFVDKGGVALIFKPNNASSSSDRVAYYATSTAHGDVIFRNEYIGGSTTTYQITADDVSIKSLIFYVSGANTSVSPTKDVNGVHDFAQPFVTVDVSGEIKAPHNVISSSTSTNIVKFTVQTSVSPRELDN